MPPYLGQGQGGLSAGAALNSELSRLDPVAGALAVDIEAVVGRFTCWKKAERVSSQCWSKMSPDTLYQNLSEASHTTNSTGTCSEVGRMNISRRI